MKSIRTTKQHAVNGATPPPAKRRNARKRRWSKLAHNQRWAVAWRDDSCLALAERAGRVGLFDWDMVSGRSIWTEQHEAIYGLPPGKFEGTHEAWARRVYPNDRARAEAKLRDAIDRRQPESELEYRIVRDDGEVRWITNHGVITYDKAGRALRMIGTTVDVTERKNFEALLRLEHAFNTALLNTTAALIVVLNPDGDIVHFNQACQTATRFSFAEVKGKNFADLFLLPEQRGDVERIYRRLLRDGRGVQHVSFIRTRHGTRRTISWSNNVLRDEAGQIEAIICTGLDISRCKQLEKKLLELGDAEQQRIGRDIHDGIGGRLTALQLFHHALADELTRVAPGLAGKFQALDAHIRDTIRAARNLAHGLSPVPAGPEGLRAALGVLAEKTTALAGIQCVLASDEPVAVQNDETAVHLYRIAEEAINNALKHSRATSIRVTLAQHGDQLELGIEDNGAGFSPSRAAAKGMGLRAMQHRAELVGAIFRLASSRRSGTRIICRMLDSQTT